MIQLTRTKAHDLADLLEALDAEVNPNGDDKTLADAWVVTLRDLAGPQEPTSYAARVIIQNGTAVEEWARESSSNAWYCLGVAARKRLWDDLLELYDTADSFIVWEPSS